MSKEDAELKVRFYKTDAGNEPVRDWLRWPISKPLVDNIGDGMWECRSTCDRVEYPVIFAVAGGEMILLNGFVKKTRATPKHERDLALQRKREGEKPA